MTSLPLTAPALPRPTSMPWTARAAFRLAMLSGRMSRLLTTGAGGTVPGRVALRLVPEALSLLAAPHRVVLVSGTNGKTTTTAMLARALSAHADVVTNADGANLSSGIVSTLLNARKQAACWAVLEVDEVTLETVAPAVGAELLVLLNLSRDQLDRTAEVQQHVLRWGRLLAGVPRAIVVANADDSLVVAAVLRARPTADGVLWVAAGKPYREDCALCPACGASWQGRGQHWQCDACGLTTPQSNWRLPNPQVLTVDGQGFSLRLGLPGRVNASNAAMAVAAAHRLGVPIDTALRQVGGVREVAGRYSTARVGAHDVQLLLAKNPAGWLEALEQLGEKSAAVIAVNARPADGADPSWLWDVPFEQLRGRLVIAAGERAADLSVRLMYAGVAHRVEPGILRAVDGLPSGAITVLANYTAFVTARSELGRAS